MELRDPIVAYVAASNVELEVLVAIFEEAGIPVHGNPDNSPVGAWVGGLIPEIHRPKLMVEREDAERAGRLLADYEARNAERRNRPKTGESIGVVCDKCGEEAGFDASLEGSVQNCPKCGAFLDVVWQDEEDEDWGEPEDLPLDGEGEDDERF
ncbi:MAG: DUF2007 domain-containing protein [Planctomycetaceae bacterium]|nr:DUF2007 domain-containing protein [Planctomycetaceae bacterium]